MPKTDHDLIVVGGGPAGLTAAMYAARARLDVAVPEKSMPGGQMLITDRIEVLRDTVVTGVGGLSRVETVHVRNLRSGESATLPVSALFVWIGILPNADFLAGQLRTDPFGFVETDAAIAARSAEAYLENSRDS